MAISNSKNERRPRSKPTLQELNETIDKLLEELIILYKEIISHAIQMNINIEDDHVSTCLWKCVCSRFYNLKDIQREELR
jgi:PP-loop superfamily ATP-utilizing enzyme